ncbi:hypothetical protein D3C80_921880 [compost metagenome]
MRAFIAINAVIHQRMAGVEQFLHFIHAVALFALGNVFPCENQIIDNRAGIGPAAEQIVIFEEGVVPVTGMRHHQRLHSDGIFFHQIGNTRI